MTQITVETLETIKIIKLIGDIDARTTPAIQQEILAIAAVNRQIILDMSRVAYMSSAGLRMLLLLYRMTDSHATNLIAIGLTEDIRDMMQITGFLNFFTTCDTLDSALASFQANTHRSD